VHVAVTDEAQLPLVSQTLSVDFTPPEQVLSLHWTVAPGNAPHAAVFVPSHVAAHTPEPPHAPRDPCGAPPAGIVVHLPCSSATSHA
jgi:hypothetical protein